MELINFIMQYIPLDYMVIVLGLIVVGQMLKNFTTLRKASASLWRIWCRRISMLWLMTN